MGHVGVGYGGMMWSAVGHAGDVGGPASVHMQPCGCFIF